MKCEILRVLPIASVCLTPLGGSVCLDMASCESMLKLSFNLKRTVRLLVIVFIVKFSVCAHSHRGTNCDREMLGWLLCRGCLRLFAIWNKRSSESQGENCGWRDNKAGVLAIWLTATWPRNVKKFWTHVESEDTIVSELEGHEIVNTETDTYSKISLRATNRLLQQCLC